MVLELVHPYWLWWTKAFVNIISFLILYRMRSIQLSDDEDMMEPVRPVGRVHRAPSGSTISAVKTRLEAPRVQQSSHSSSSAAGPSGYRIVVSNLQSTVTHEDIRVRFIALHFLCC